MPQMMWRDARSLVSQERISISPDQAGGWLVELEDTGYLNGELVLDTLAVRHHAFGRWLRASTHNRIAFMRVWEARQQLNDTMSRAPDEMKDVTSRSFIRKLLNMVGIGATIVLLGGAAVYAYAQWIKNVPIGA